MPPPSRSHALLRTLRARIAALQPDAQAVVPFGDPHVDAHLPGGLVLGQLHEIGTVGLDCETGALAAAFAASLLARLPDQQGAIVWIATSCDLYPPGLPAYGLDPARLVLVQTANDTETLQAMEAALSEGGAAAVLGEVGRLDRLPARRLQLACGKRGITGFVLRRWPCGCKQGGRLQRASQEGNAAATRWRLSPKPSAAEQAAIPWDPGPQRWRVELLHARGGRPGAWIMEKREAKDAATTHPLRVVAALADDPAAPPGAGLRSAG
jgi:protein ImuA